NSIEIIILFLYSKQGITIALSCSNSTGNSVNAIGYNGEVCVDQDFITSSIQACYNTSNFINQSKNACKNFFFSFTSTGHIIILNRVDCNSVGGCICRNNGDCSVVNIFTTNNNPWENKLLTKQTLSHNVGGGSSSKIFS